MFRKTATVRRRRTFVVWTLCAAGALGAAGVHAASLTPTRPALMRQVQGARRNRFAYLQDGSEVLSYVREGRLVALPGNSHYMVKRGVEFPYARPEVKLFLERLSRQYSEECGEKLVVTSLVRPRDEQPRNSSPLSVHPTGMAMDLRIPGLRGCRSWLESTLLGLENAGVLEAAREHHPPHYHVVLFPQRYSTYLADKRSVAPADSVRLAAARSEVPAGAPKVYRVRAGDSLWDIAQQYGTTVADLRRLNGLHGSSLGTGQLLVVTRGSADAGRDYRVRPGDNLWQIAQRYGVSVRAIERANRLGSSSLEPGQVLAIPVR